MFEGSNPEKAWQLLRTVFDVFAMHDVSLLLPKIVKWLNKSLGVFPGRQLEADPEELYQEFKTGVDLACVLALYVSEPAELVPDFGLIY